MKKIILLSLMLLAVGLTRAQVGINTESPQDVFHIDPQKNTIGGANAADDVIVTSSGNVGVGTTSPTTKLDIRSSSAGAIRIADGSQGVGKVLIAADDTGSATWRNIPGSWFASLEGGYVDFSTTLSTVPITFTASSISSASLGSVSIADGGTIRVPYTGVYRVSIMGSGHTDRAPSHNGFHVTFLRFAENGSYTWTPHTQGKKEVAPTEFGFLGFFPLNANDVLSITNNQSSKDYSNYLRNVILYVEFLQ